MPHSFGVRARTRDLFSKPYKKHGAVPYSRYATTFRVGDYVDVIVDGSIHKAIFTAELCSRTRFSLAEILVLAGTAGAGRMAPPVPGSLLG